MAQASQLVQSTLRQSVRSLAVQPDSLSFVGAGGDSIEHIGQKTVGYATRDGANVEIAFEAAQVRRPLLSVDSLVERGQVAVCTDFGELVHHPEVCAAGDPAVERLVMKRQNGHFWRPLARRVETSVSLVMVAPPEGAAEGQDVDEKMDEELPIEERSARVVQKPGEPTPEEQWSAHEGTHLPFRATGVHTASRAERPTWLTGPRRERRVNRRWRRSTASSLHSEHGDQRRAGRHSGPGGHHLHGNLLWKAQSLLRSARRLPSPTW